MNAMISTVHFAAKSFNNSERFDMVSLTQNPQFLFRLLSEGIKLGTQFGKYLYKSVLVQLKVIFFPRICFQARSDSPDFFHPAYTIR